MSGRETAAASAAPPVLGLRERKKLKTKQIIRREAYRLFAEQGYENTTVEQIADAAEVSPRTFFRYFPTKEDVVVSDDYDPLMVEALDSRPEHEAPIEAIRHALTDAMSRLLVADREELLFRTRLAYEVPAVRARSMEEKLHSQEAFAALIAERTGRAVDDLEVKCAAAAITAVSTMVVQHWVEGGGTEDLAELYDHCLGMLSRGLKL